MTSITSDFDVFDPDPDEMANCFEIGNDFDFERDFISEDHEYKAAPVPSRLMGSSPSGSDGSAAAEQIAFADNSNQHNFPLLLHEIVSNEEYDCIHWLPCGTFFAISDKDVFTKQVIPRFFGVRGGTKFTSFTRRLKRWAFSRVASGTNIGAYHHKSFRRGEPDLAATILYPAKGAKKGSPTTVKPKVKARRRATTGCMVDQEKFDYGCTPIPIKDPVQMLANPALLELDSDMAELLASPDFIRNDEPIAKVETSASDMPATPPFSPSTLEPAPVTDFTFRDTFKETFTVDNKALPTSVQSDKLRFSSTYHGMNTSIPIQSQTIFQNTSFNMMHQMQQAQHLQFPGMFNLNQQQAQRHTFQPQMRRHSCMPMFGSSDMNTASVFGAAGPMGVYNQMFNVAPTSAFNPTMQGNNTRMNQNIGQDSMINIISSKFPNQVVNVMGTSSRKISPEFLNQKAVNFTRTSSCEVTSRDFDQDDKCIDFDEYIARQDD